MREDNHNKPDLDVETQKVEEIQDHSDRISTIKNEVNDSSSVVKSKKKVSEHSRAVIFDELNLHLRRFLLVFPLVIVAMLAAAIMIQFMLLSAAGIQTRQYLDDADSLTADLNDRFEEVNDRYVTERVTKLLGQNDLYVYTNSLWEYEITANGVSADDNEITVQDSEGKVVVVLTEVRKENPLPDAIVNVGSVTRGDNQDKIEMHISVKATTGAGAGAVSGSDSDVVPVVIQDGLKKTYTFEVGGVSKGDRVVITISDQLGAEIGIPFNEIGVLIG